MDDNKALERAEIIAALWSISTGHALNNELCMEIGWRTVCGLAADLLKHDAEPPNDPLTLEELREMAGDPVWWSNTTDCFASIVIPAYHNEPIWVLTWDTQTDEAWRRKAKRLLQCGYKPYRRKPEGGGE